jgi:hypothetical protein
MKHLEDELRRALKRKQPSGGFTERVLALAADSTSHGSWFYLFARRNLRWALAGGMCLLLVAAGLGYLHWHEQQLRGEKAKAQLLQALRITADKLEIAQVKVQQHGIRHLYGN